MPSRQIAFIDDHCFSTGCVQCVLACEVQAIRRKGSQIFINYRKCSLCGECIEACPESNLKIVGQTYSIDELLTEVLKDKVFYSHSGGGITLSGGEPLLQSKFCCHFLERCKASSLRTVVDTSLAVKWEAIESVEKHTDLFYVDLKHVDDHVHRKYVGASNQSILKNIERMSKEISPEKVIIRIPFVPGVNDDKVSIERMAKYVRRLRAEWRIHLLPYHCLGERKYSLVGREYPFKNFHPPTDDEIEKGVQYYRRWDLDVEVIR